MTDETQAATSQENLIKITCDIVTAYVGNNPLAPSDIPNVISNVHRSLQGLSDPSSVTEVKQKPAVPIKRSVTPDYIICLEDGKKLKMLKRYLRSNYDMTPEEYREKWGLRLDYPMVAPNYSEQRSKLAKKIGLGKKGQVARKTRKKRAK